MYCYGASTRAKPILLLRTSILTTRMFSIVLILAFIKDIEIIMSRKEGLLGKE